VTAPPFFFPIQQEQSEMSKKKSKSKDDTKRTTKLELKAQAIAACRDTNGRITPKAVWLAARNPKSILHGEFEWNIEKAAEDAWNMRARELIREVTVFITRADDSKIIIPYYISDPSTNESAYVPTARIAKSASKSARVLQQEIDRIRGSIHRALGLAIAFGLENRFERMLSELIEAEQTLAENEGDDAR